MFRRSSAGWRKRPRLTSANVTLLCNWPRARQKGEAWLYVFVIRAHLV